MHAGGNCRTAAGFQHAKRLMLRRQAFADFARKPVCESAKPSRYADDGAALRDCERRGILSRK
jgi:hypothetical protein